MLSELIRKQFNASKFTDINTDEGILFARILSAAGKEK